VCVWGGGLLHARPHNEIFVNILLSRAFILKDEVQPWFPNNIQ